MNRRSKLNTLLAVTASIYLGFATPALAQNPTVIKLGWTTSDGAQDPYAAGARAFQSAVERETSGCSPSTGACSEGIPTLPACWPTTSSC